MSAVDWALVALAGAGAVLLVVLSLVAMNLFRTVSSVRALADGLTQTTAKVNAELERVDAITASAQRVASNVEAVTDTVRATVTNPLVKALAFAAGARRAGKAFKDS